MFSGFMINTWEVATIVAVVAGVVGFFVVMRGSSFVAHAVPQSAFAGAAGANLIGVSTIAGLGVFALIAALAIGWLGISQATNPSITETLAWKPGARRSMTLAAITLPPTRTGPDAAGLGGGGGALPMMLSPRPVPPGTPTTLAPAPITSGAASL